MILCFARNFFLTANEKFQKRTAVEMVCEAGVDEQLFPRPIGTTLQRFSDKGYGIGDCLTLNKVASRTAVTWASRILISVRPRVSVNSFSAMLGEQRACVRTHAFLTSIWYPVFQAWTM